MRQNSLSSSTRVRQVARLSYLRNFGVGSRLAVRHDQRLPPSERMLSTSPNDTKGGIEVRSASLNAALGDQPQIGTVPLLISGGVCGAEARPPELLLFLLQFVSRSSSKGTLHLHSRISHVAPIRRSGKSGFDRCRRVKPCVKKWSIKRQNRRYSSGSIRAISAIIPPASSTRETVAGRRAVNRTPHSGSCRSSGPNKNCSVGGTLWRRGNAIPISNVRPLYAAPSRSTG